MFLDRCDFKVPYLLFPHTAILPVLWYEEKNDTLVPPKPHSNPSITV